MGVWVPRVSPVWGSVGHLSNLDAICLPDMVNRGQSTQAWAGSMPCCFHFYVVEQIEKVTNSRQAYQIIPPKQKSFQIIFFGTWWVLWCTYSFHEQKGRKVSTITAVVCRVRELNKSNLLSLPKDLWLWTMQLSNSRAQMFYFTFNHGDSRDTVEVKKEWPE